MSLRDRLSAKKPSTKVTEEQVDNIENEVEEVAVEETPKAAKKTATKKDKETKPAKVEEAKKEKAPKEPKEDGKKFNFVDVCSYDADLDAIDEAINAEDSHKMLVKAIEFYNESATDLQALLLASYVNNGGAVKMSDMKEAYKNFKGKRPAEFKAKSLLQYFETANAEYTAEDVLKWVPETEDEVYFILLFVENGWNQMAPLSIKGKAREALYTYIVKDEEEK